MNALRLPVDEGRAVELVAAGLGHGVEHAACGIADFCAEILGFDLIFLDGDLREGVAEISRSSDRTCRRG